MTDRAPSDRHLTSEGLEYYLAAGVPAVVKIDGTPAAYLVVEPGPRRLRLRTPLDRNCLPDVSAYRHLSAAVMHWNDVSWCEIQVEGAAAREAYPVLCSIADRIQLQGLPFDTAVLGALAAFKDVLAHRERLSFEEEIGLFGELLIVGHLLAQLPPTDVMAAWRGPDGEEHDFDIGDADVEIKSTISEERTHWIGDADQLEPTAGRSLWLMSIQVTAAGAGGLSLADLVSKISSHLSGDPAAEAFERKLALMRWRADEALLYPRKYRLRSEPAVFAVDDDFPALTRRRLTNAGVNLSHVRQFKYALNLDGLIPFPAAPDLLKNVSIA